jgi:hypothetical protein
MFSVVSGSFKGNPTIEILRDGQPWGEDNVGPEHFSFGITKLRMIRAALPIVEKFVESRGGDPWPDQVHKVTDVTGSGIVSAEVHKHEDFSRRDGQQISLPYLRLVSGKTSLGVGLKKCEAILDLWPHLDGFLASHGQNRLFA